MEPNPGDIYNEGYEAGYKAGKEELEKAVEEERRRAVEIIKDELRKAPLEVQMSKGVIFANVIQRIAPTKTDKQ